MKRTLILSLFLLGTLVPTSNNGFPYDRMGEELFAFSKEIVRSACISFATYYIAHKIFIKSEESKLQTSNNELGNKQSITKVGFSDIVGAKAAKEELQNIVKLINANNAQQLPRGILLVGSPGNGKTLLAKALSHEVKCTFYYISGSEFIETFMGANAARITLLFDQARKKETSIIFIDEIDSIGQGLNQLLVEMDCFNTNSSNVIVIGATNKLDALDPALRRSGRFDQIITIANPTEEERKEILKFYLDKLNYNRSIDLKAIAQKTQHWSAADLVKLVNRASLIALNRKSNVIAEQDLLQAYHEVMLVDQGDSYKKSETKFADVAGAAEAKEELLDIVEFLKNPEKFNRLGARVPRGVLLFGDPGNGKTLLARAVAGEANCHFINVNGSEFVDKYIGVGARRIRELFERARKYGTCIIFIDEIDAIGSNRIVEDYGIDHNQTLNQLLVEMDGFATDGPTVIVMGATNRKEVLDPALMRRFTKHIEVPFPDTQSRYEILKMHAMNKRLDSLVDLSNLAQATGGFSAATLANLLNEAALLSAKRDENTMILSADIEKALDKIVKLNNRKQ